MSKITTEICKEYLINHFVEKNIESTAKEWKRVKKYKNDEDLWVREFEHASLGLISLLEKEGKLEIYENSGLNLDNKVIVPQIIKKEKSKEIVDLLTFNTKQIQIGKDIYTKYYTNDFDDLEEIEDLHTDLAIKKNYTKIQFIPGILQWFVPEDTYDNGELENLSLNKNMNGFYISMFDIYDIHDYGGEEHLLKGFLPTYLSKDDEYNYKIMTDIKFIDLIKDLASFGYKYTDKKRDDCLAIKVMKKVNYNNISFVPNKIEELFVNDDLNAFKSLEVINQNKINWKNDNNFFILAEKHFSEKIVNYLFENKYEISNSNISNFRMNNWFVFKSGISEYIVDKISGNEYIKEYDSYVFQYFQNKIEYKKYDEALLWLNIYNNNHQEITSNYINADLLKFKENEVLPIYVKFLQKRDSQVNDFILYGLEDNINILKYKEIKDAISLNYLMNLFKGEEDESLENINQHSKRGFEMVMIDYTGNQRTRSQELSDRYSDITFLKNKIIAHFSGSNDSQEKPKYRTKF